VGINTGGISAVLQAGDLYVVMQRPWADDSNGAMSCTSASTHDTVMIFITGSQSSHVNDADDLNEGSRLLAAL